MKIMELINTGLYKLVNESSICWLVFCPTFGNPHKIIAVENMASFEDISFTINSNSEITGIFF